MPGRRVTPGATGAHVNPATGRASPAIGGDQTDLMCKMTLTMANEACRSGGFAWRLSGFEQAAAFLGPLQGSVLRCRWPLVPGAPEYGFGQR
jgi:hypothetical protein